MTSFYDISLRGNVLGERTTQESYSLRYDGALKPATEHLLKFGGEFTFYNLNSDLAKLEPRKTYFGKPLINEPQLNLRF